VCEQRAQGCYLAVPRLGVEPATSGTFPLDHQATLATVAVSRKRTIGLFATVADTKRSRRGPYVAPYWVTQTVMTNDFINVQNICILTY